MNPVTSLSNLKKLLFLGVIAGAVVLISLGVWIEGLMTNGLEQKARMYQTAVQVKNDGQLNYSIDTKQGNVWADVSVKSVDLVRFPEMNKSFSKVKKTEEEYHQKEREVCETKYRTETRTRTEYDSDGKPYTETYTEEVPYDDCHEETYYEWDYVQEWNESAKEVNMAGRNYSLDLFSLSMRSIDAKDIIDGQTGKYVTVESKGLFNVDVDLFNEADVGDKRYSYDVMELPQSGTVLLNVSEGVKDAESSKINLRTNSAQKSITDAKNASQTMSTVFTVFWSILVLAELLGLGYVVYQYEEF